MDATPGGEGSEGPRLHPRPSAFRKLKRPHAREVDSAQNRPALGSAAADPNSLLAGNFLAPRSAFRSKKPCNVMALLALQPAACRPDQARNWEFPTTGTGRYQALSERNRERTGGRKQGARPGAVGLQAAARIPFPNRGVALVRGPTRARCAARAKTILLSSIDASKLHAGGPDPSRPKYWNAIGRI